MKLETIVASDYAGSERAYIIVRDMNEPTSPSATGRKPRARFGSLLANATNFHPGDIVCWTDLCKGSLKFHAVNGCEQGCSCIDQYGRFNPNHRDKTRLLPRTAMGIVIAVTTTAIGVDDKVELKWWKMTFNPRTVVVLWSTPSPDEFE